MSTRIKTMYPESGRIIKEDGVVINIGDVIAAVFDSANNVLKTSSLQVKTLVFHDTVIATGNGLTHDVIGYKNLTISCKGTNTSRTIEVHGIDFNGVDNIITGYTVTDSASKATLTSNDLSVSYTVDGMISVYVKITALAGGNATIKGMLTL
jgi:hypothetical protein